MRVPELLRRQPPGYTLTTGRILAIYSGLMVTLMLAALDQTIVATALPRIVGDLGGLTQYSWVFTAYMLTSSEGGEHPAGEKPPSQETEYQQERPQDGRGRSEIAQESATAGRYEDGRAVDEDRLAPGHVSQEEHPHGRRAARRRRA